MQGTWNDTGSPSREKLALTVPMRNNPDTETETELKLYAVGSAYRRTARR